MKALTTRVGTYVTGDAVADAVLDYGLALARARQVDLVDVPFRATGGEIARVQFRIGWMSDVDVVNDGHRGPEVTDDAATAELRARERALHPRGDTPLAAEEVLSLIGLDEY